MKQEKASSPEPAAGQVPQAELEQLFAHFNASRHADMEVAALSLAARFPGDGQAWKALGVARLVQGKDALDALHKAAALLPTDAEVLSSLGGALAARGELPRSAACYRQALHARPAFAQVHSNLGDVLVRLGEWQAAESSCRQALRLQPGLAAAHLNLGNALMGQDQREAAVAAYREALALNPRLAEAHRALGIALKEQGALQEAVASLQRAVQLRPHHAATQDQLGVVLHADGQFEDALVCLRTAVALQPGLAAPHWHLAHVLADLGRPAEAAASYRDALQLMPDVAELHVNLGTALLATGQLSEAVGAFRQALQLQPGLALAHSNLGNALAAQGELGAALQQHRQAVSSAPELSLVHSNLAHHLKTLGRPEEAQTCAREALALAPERLALHSESLFLQQYLPPTADAASQALQHARHFGHRAVAEARPFTSWSNAPDPGRRLRIGLVSGDLRAHPVAYFLESVLAALATQAAERLQVHAYANQRSHDAYSQRLQAHCRGWLPVADLDDAALATRIRADGIDLLIDLSGHTLHNRLPMLAWRPAPVQVSWLGYCATTGLEAVDAFIGDPWITPPGSEAAFTERVVRLPESFLCFTPPALDLPVGPLPASADQGLRFACFNHVAKINEAVVHAWSRILRALPDSQLLLQSPALQDDEVRRHLGERFARHGVPAGQLQMGPAQGREDYLARYQQVDMALDPFPYPGGTTSLEALWMGVPVLTLRGESALARQGSSILRNLGLPEWVATDADDYVARALRHAADRLALARLRQTLRPRLLQSPLCDAPRFALHLEQALRDLWQGWCETARHRSGTA